MQMRLSLLLAASAVASAYITTPGFLGGKLGQSAAISRASDFNLRLRSSNGAARSARAQSIQMMAAATKKKSVSDLSRKELEGKKVCKGMSKDNLLRKSLRVLSIGFDPLRSQRAPGWQEDH
jgi:hypothetical protein